MLSNVHVLMLKDKEKESSFEQFVNTKDATNKYYIIFQGDDYKMKMETKNGSTLEASLKTFKTTNKTFSFLGSSAYGIFCKSPCLSLNGSFKPSKK